MSILFPDVSGHRPDGRTIVHGGTALQGRAPFWRLLARRAAARVPPDLARCRALSLQLRLLARAGSVPIRNALAQFIHIPPIGEGRRPGTQARIDTGASRAPAKPFCWPCSPRSAVYLNALSRRGTAAGRGS
jgi:hypothetical protein